MAELNVYLSKILLQNKNIEEQLRYPLDPAVLGTPAERIVFTTTIGDIENGAAYISASGPTYTTHELISSSDYIAAHHITAYQAGLVVTLYVEPLYIIRWKFSTPSQIANYFYFIGTQSLPTPRSYSYGEYGSIISCYGGVNSGWHSYPIEYTGIKMRFSHPMCYPHTTKRSGDILS